MNKILLIVSREYLTRVRKKSFIILTILVPLLIMLMYAGIFALVIKGDELSGPRNVIVIDDSGIFKNKLKEDKTIRFSYLDASIEEAKKIVKSGDNTYLLYIPKFEGDQPLHIELMAKKQAGLGFSSDIENQLENVIRDRKLTEAGIDQKVLDNLKTNISIDTKKLTEKGEEAGSSGAAFGVGMAASILIYMFIFLYGVQVMRGVIEEKTNRIIEVIISSVKPFQLMMGKIIGVALVGLTQFLLWVILTSTIGSVAMKALMPADAKHKIEQMQKQPGASIKAQQPDNPAAKIFDALNTIPFGMILGCFLFYFLGGYLLYSAIFAAIGSAVDNETETQQFMLPVTLPLIFAFIFSVNFVVNNPDSPISFWMSMIPFFSPVVMMVRIPYGVAPWELALSMALLIAGFFGTVWLAARIYRTGILMYGKKASWKELGKWLFYK
ncbi:ABC transporter permease [Solitalea sp. MAHUQ-68]|uniref:ABC transporter permease n=1 Tax=Solitalea agri TaxID=2953739 RepID=A0A9X2F4T8_9SPHI|nr:ABC transporter permease [Solitalea agri]MCO4294170.1 ABC transporter permease [Solitalea agri]